MRAAPWVAVKAARDDRCVDNMGAWSTPRRQGAVIASYLISLALREVLKATAPGSHMERKLNH